MSKLTVILPAAGKGKRLNLPYPKEILRLNKEKALIDNSFDLFMGLDPNLVEFVVVISEEKTEIFSYLSKYKAKFNISFTYQKPQELEYTGAIKSASHLFGENNLVLLPDTILKLQKCFNLVEQVKLYLKKYKFAFFFKPEIDEEILATKGCLKLDKNHFVLLYEDKPKGNKSKFNGFWCAFAFKREVFEECISFMEQSTLKLSKPKINIEQTKIFKSKAIEVDGFVDLGTWGEIGKLISKS